MRRTSSGRSICFYPGQNGRCSKIVANSKVKTSRYFGFVYHDTNGLNHGPAWKTQSFLLSEICTVILRQDYYGKGNSRKFYWNTDGKKFRDWQCLFVNREKDYSCLCMWTISNSVERNRTFIGLGKSSWRCWFGRTNIKTLTTFTWHALKENEKSVKILLTILNDFCRSYRKITQLGETWCEHIYMVLWHGRSRKEIRGKILRIFERNPPAIV